MFHPYLHDKQGNPIAISSIVLTRAGQDGVTLSNRTKLSELEILDDHTFIVM